MQPQPLTSEQQAMIKVTLARIRGALSGSQVGPAPEPAHIFQPGPLSASGGRDDPGT